MTTLNRLTASRSTSYLPWAELNDEDRAAMIDELLERTRRLARIDLVTLLGASWRVIRRRSHQFAAVRGSNRGNYNSRRCGVNSRPPPVRNSCSL